MRRWLAACAPYLATLAVAVYFGVVSEASRDQSCTLFERGHLTDVRQLQATYDYLERVPLKRLRNAPPGSLNGAVLRGLEAQEDRARTDSAPAFCDGGSVLHGELGLDEPDPTVPERPARLDAILGQR